MENSVETLHAEYIISSETFLFCVENNLQTLEEVADCFADGTVVCSARVRSEVESIIKKHLTPSPAQDEEIQPSWGPHHTDGRAKEYSTLKDRCTVRTQNALNYLESWLGYPSDAFWAFLLDKSSRIYNFKRIRNVGNKTVAELLDLADVLEEMPEVETTQESSKDISILVSAANDDNHHSSGNLDLFEYAVGQEINQLPARPRNALLSLLNKCGNSIVELRKTLNALGFDLHKVKNIGKGTIPELRVFIERMEVLWNLHQSSDGQMPKDNSIRVNALQKSFGLTEQEAWSIIEEFPDSETPPLFKMLDTIMRRNHRDWTIISNGLNIFQDQPLISGLDIADKVGLSRERVRQLRNKLYKSICHTLSAWSNRKRDYDFTRYLDYCQMEYNDQQLDPLNKEEKVYFNSNFTYRVLGLFFNEQYSLIGDDFKTFTEPNTKGYNIFIVPTELSAIFNFSGMMNDLQERISSKVFKKYSIELYQHLLLFFWDDIYFDKMPVLLDLCRKIIHRNLGIVADDYLVIEQNANKTIPELVEDILSQNGQVMTLDEIHHQFEALYPGMTKDKNALRGSIIRSENIVPVGRSSSYVLKQWEEKGIRGGTIRDIVFDHLLESGRPLPVEDISGHVQTFREGTNTSSIYYNLFADRAKRFSVFERDGERLIGLSHIQYSDTYTLIEDGERAGSKRDFSESISLLEQFILKNNRFPFSSSDDADEMRIHRFWGLHKARREKGKLPPEQLIEMERIEDLYGDKEYSKKDYIAMLRAKISSMRATLFEAGIDPDML